MSTIAIKKHIHQAIEIIDNPQTLKVIQLILDQEIQYTKEIINPFTLEEFYDRNKQSQKEIKQGKLAEHKTVKAKYGKR